MRIIVSVVLSVALRLRRELRCGNGELAAVSRRALVDGLGEGGTLPDTWSPTENVVWKVGHSRLGLVVARSCGATRSFLTSAVGENERARSSSSAAIRAGTSKPTDVHRWMTYCLDFARPARSCGNVRRIAARRRSSVIPGTRTPTPRRSATANASTRISRTSACSATTSPATNLWEQRWGSYPMRDGWGQGASRRAMRRRPAVSSSTTTTKSRSWSRWIRSHGQTNLARRTRERRAIGRRPYVWRNDSDGNRDDRDQSNSLLRRQTASFMWELADTSGFVSQTPVAKHGLLYVGAGYHYGPLYAVRPGAAGDISLKSGETSNSSIAWSQPRGSSIHPVLSDQRRTTCSSCYDAGLLACSNALTGEVIFPAQALEHRRRAISTPRRGPTAARSFCLTKTAPPGSCEDGPEFNDRTQERPGATWLGRPLRSRAGACSSGRIQVSIGFRKPAAAKASRDC
jgi:hypothetical protein